MIASLIFPLASQSLKYKLIKWWCKHLLVSFNISITSYGHIPANNQAMAGAMFVANHISWMDIHALNSIVSMRFIAKSEIKSWPIFGYLARKANVLFIDRGKRQEAGRIVHMTSNSLKGGDNLCLFPEGTTTDGTKMMPFKSSIIQAAIHAKSTIYPVAIRYPGINGKANTEMAYAGETTMRESMQQILMQQNPIVELHFLAPVSTLELHENDKDRRKLTQQIERQIKEKLSL
jgi:1-acyl-sn-glycerol-3-phosphate acyltransferase